MIVDIHTCEAEALAPYRDIVGARGADAPMVVEGVTALERLVAGGHALHSVLTTPSALSRLHAWLPADVPRLVAPAALLREVVGYAFHRGVLALAPRPVPRLPEGWRTVVVAERITDPSNVGALVRNARALGADALLIDAQSGDPFGRRAIRVSMGCCFHVPIIRCELQSTLQALRQSRPELRCIAATCHPEAVPLHRFAWPACSALLMGNEGYGLSPPLLALADSQVHIPMAQGTDSLNVAAATAIFLYNRGAARATLELDDQSR